MGSIGIVTLLIILVTCYASYNGIRELGYFDRYTFQVDKILIHKEYTRLFTSGFIHVGWMHLVFNLVAFNSFGSALEHLFGIPKYLGLYLGSLLGGNLFALFIHRNHSAYTACGASGAISGLIFSFITLYPDSSLGLLIIPVHLPGWVFGLVYILVSIYGIRSRAGNIGHEAHLGGGVAGMLITLLMFPSALAENYITILVMLIPAAVFMYLTIARPEFLLVENPFSKPTGDYTVEDRYNDARRRQEKLLDHLLDKIHRHGIESLTRKEKEQLEKLSNSK